MSGETAGRRRSPLRRLWRIVALRRRLAGSVLTGLVLWLVLRGTMAGNTRALLGWNLGAGLYCVSTWALMLRSDVTSLRGRAARQDEAEWVVVALTTTAALVSLVAIGIELHAAKAAPGAPDLWRIALAGATILISWVFMHSVITLHYARLFYGRGPVPAGGLDFPKTPEPDYVDFLYFSFTIAAAAQTSDVAVTSRSMRRLVLAHSILAFVFNTTILALAINVGAGLL